MENETSLHINKNLPANINKVWKAWTNADDLAAWFCPEGMTATVHEMDVKVGGKYRITMAPPEGDTYTAIGEYKEVVPNEKLVFSWQWEGDEQVSEVTILFTDKGKTTDMDFHHDQFESKESRDKHEEGWVSTFVKLVAFFEKG